MSLRTVHRNLALSGALYAAPIVVGAVADTTNLKSMAAVPQGLMGTRNAHAQLPTLSSSQTDDAIEACEYSYTVKHTIYYFAQHAYPKNSVQTLARVSLLGHKVSSDETEPPGYDYQRIETGIYIRDGSIAVLCGSSVSGLKFDSISFVMPKTYKLELDAEDPW